jgi:hypothetical protein
VVAPVVLVRLLPRPRVFAWLSLAALRLVGLVRAERPGKIPIVMRQVWVRTEGVVRGRRGRVGAREGCDRVTASGELRIVKGAQLGLLEAKTLSQNASSREECL